jgi:hypothetical protein
MMVLPTFMSRTQPRPLPGTPISRLASVIPAPIGIQPRKNQTYSIRINDPYRVCFRWEDGYADDGEVTDYH